MSDICQHCGINKKARPRGLCARCYYKDEVRSLYSAWGRIDHGYRGVGHLTPHETPAPTSAAPGSPEKLIVLASRAEKGLKLWNPLDTHMRDHDDV